jgi:uncharacterized protein (UPF0548 family)
VAELRIGRGWTDKELEERLAALRKAGTNFPLEGPESQAGHDWRRYYTESVIGKETPGAVVPGGAFEIAHRAIAEYQFSDPDIVTGHFSPRDPVDGRTMALEIKIFGLHYLCGVRISAVRSNEDRNEVTWAFRYDTLEGHMEVGSEWFTLTKRKDTGEVWFRISASWRPGRFPNWWSRLGFHVLSRRYQLAWHRLAYLRLRDIVGSKGAHLKPIPYGERLVHTGPDISNSPIWELNKPTANARVHEVSKRAPQTEHAH